MAFLKLLLLDVCLLRLVLDLLLPSASWPFNLDLDCGGDVHSNVLDRLFHCIGLSTGTDISMMLLAV